MMAANKAAVQAFVAADAASMRRLTVTVTGRLDRARVWLKCLGEASAKQPVPLATSPDGTVRTGQMLARPGRYRMSWVVDGAADVAYEVALAGAGAPVSSGERRTIEDGSGAGLEPFTVTAETLAEGDAGDAGAGGA